MNQSDLFKKLEFNEIYRKPLSLPEPLAALIGSLSGLNPGL